MLNTKKAFIFTALLTACCLFSINHTSAMNINKHLNFFLKTRPYSTFIIRLANNNRILLRSAEYYSSSDPGLAITGMYRIRSKSDWTLHDTRNAPSHYIPLYNPDNIYKFLANFFNSHQIDVAWFGVRLSGYDDKIYCGTMHPSAVYKGKLYTYYDVDNPQPISYINIYGSLDNEIQTIGIVEMPFGVCKLVWHKGKFWLEPTPMLPLKLNLDL